MEIVSKIYRGRVDASLRPWAMEGGNLMEGGRVIATCRAHNFAAGGFDVGLETMSDLPGVRHLLQKLPRKGNHLAAIAAWVERHPEALRRDEVRLARVRADREPAKSAGAYLRRMLVLHKELEADRIRRYPKTHNLPSMRGKLDSVRAIIKATRGKLSYPIK